MSHDETGRPTPAGRFAWILAALMIAAIRLVPAQEPAPRDLHFERIGKESGPPPEVITALYQDREGFVWIGSRDGLFRYDGYSFVGFEHDVSDPTSIPDHSIRVIYEDQEREFWVGTNTGGLARLNRENSTFEVFRHDSADPSSLSHDSVYAVLRDGGGQLWVGTQRGLNRFDPELGGFQRFYADPGQPGSLHNDYIYTIYEDRQGQLWVGTLGGGLHRWDPANQSFVVYRHDPDNPASLSNDAVHAIVEDLAGRMWIGTGNGLNLMNPADGSFMRLLAGEGSPLVTSLAAGHRGGVWVGTLADGVFHVDPETLALRSWRHRPGDLSSLSSNRIIWLLSDISGHLWIGTWGGGLNRVTTSSMALSALEADARGWWQQDQDVSALFSDRQGGIWVGTRDGRLYRRDPRTGEDRYYIPGTGGILLKIVEDSRGKIWIGSSSGLKKLDPRTGTIQTIERDAGNPTSLGPGYVKAIHVDRSGSRWVGTGEGGLHRIDSQGRVLQRFQHDPEDPQSLSDDYVTALNDDEQGTLWVGTRSGGLNALDLETGTTRRYLPVPGDPRSISHHNVTSVFEDSRNRLWVATAGGGLNRIDRDADGSVRFARFTENEGLIDNDVMAILQDDDGSLWLSTRRGLARFQPDQGDVANIYVADGLPTGHFEPDAATRVGATLYYGSVKGVVAVPSGTPFPEPTASPTMITSIRTARTGMEGDRPVSAIDAVEVPYGEWLSFEFSVLDFQTEQRHRYAYRLGGARSEWIDLGPRREITFTDLDPGSYELSVRGRNGQGVWSATTSPLLLRVVPPFWMTPWFRAIAALGILLLFLVGHLVRTSGLEKRHRELLAAHTRREEAEGELRVAYNRLRRLTRRLEAAKEDERRRIARELHDELGQTLTAIKINLQVLPGGTDPSRLPRRIDDTIELVDRMIQRVRNLTLDLRPPLLDELGLVPALRGYAEAQGRRAGLEIDVEADSGIDRFPTEFEIACFRVVQEAVTNVIRHAGAARVDVIVEKMEDGLELVIRDDGCGFDVEEAMGRTAGEQRLGLLGMRERVEGLGGELNVRSSPGSGTRIRARVPVGARP